MIVVKKKITLTPLPTKPAVPKKPAKPATKKPPVNSLPSDEYRNEFEPLQLDVNEKIQIRFSVMRKGELGLPYADMRLYIKPEGENEFMPTKKGINFPIEHLNSVINSLEEVYEKCDAKDLFYGLED